MLSLDFIPIQQLSLLMQSTNPSDQRINYTINRQRPLQKSLVLPDHFSPQNHNAPKTIPLIPDFAYQPMKRSSTTLPENSTPLNLNTSQYAPSPSYNFTTNSAPSSSTLLPQHSFDQRATSQHELLHHPGTSSLKNLNTMARSNIMSEQDNKNFYKQKRQNLQLKISNPIQPEVIDIQMIVNQVAAQIKKEHLPNMIRSIKKEFLDDLHNYRVEFQIFKDEVKAYQAESQEMLSWFKNHEKTMDNNPKKDHHHSRSPKSPLKQKEFQLEWIEAQFFALEERLTQYQTKVYDSINQLNTKFQTEIKQKLPKISLIKSTFPPFALDYKESFIISNPIKSFPEITISQSTYYIDKFGYLLDQDNHYLLDNRGNQIKIEQKHLRLLEQHRIITK